MMAIINDAHCCFICDQQFQAGEMVLSDVNEGLGHRACFGDDREGYVKDLDTGEPLAPDEAIPAGEPYDPADYPEFARNAQSEAVKTLEWEPKGGTHGIYAEDGFGGLYFAYDDGAWSSPRKSFPAPLDGSGSIETAKVAAQADHALTHPAPPLAVTDVDVTWRDLALQFDGHRIEALALLRYVSEAGNSYEGVSRISEIRPFLAKPPLSGEVVLANRIAALTAALEAKQ